MPKQSLPPMPPIGKPESYYAHKAHQAERRGEHHAHEAAKVGQYVTLALDGNLTWEQKAKYFEHAIKRHCVPPPLPDDDVWMFYQQLADMVREQAGQEALRLACLEDDVYESRQLSGVLQEDIEDDASLFFAKLIPTANCPSWFKEDDYRQLKMIRDQWV